MGVPLHGDSAEPTGQRRQIFWLKSPWVYHGRDPCRAHRQKTTPTGKLIWIHLPQKQNKPHDLKKHCGYIPGIFGVDDLQIAVWLNLKRQ